MYAHLEETPPAVTPLRPDLPAAIDGVVARSMAKSPEDRFFTCGELVDAARAALGASTSGSSAADGRAVGPPGAPGVPTAIRTAVRRAGAPSEAPPAAPPTRRRPTALIVAAVVVALALIGTAVAVVTGGSGREHASGTPSGLPSNAPSVVPSNGAPGQTPNPVPGAANGRIAFVENGNVVSMQTDGSGRVPLTTSATRRLGEADGTPVWSPDGSKIALLRTATGVSAPVVTDGLVVVPVDPDGQPGSEFSPTDQIGIMHPAWAPDSGSIAFVRDRPDTGDGVVTVVAARPGASPQVLTEFDATGDSDVAFSHDGRWVYFVEARRLDVTGLVLSQPVVAAVAPGPGTACCPQVAPDDRLISLVTDASGARQLVVAKPNGRPGTVLAPEVPLLSHSVPVWSPDGTRLLFVSNASGDPDIYVVNVDGTGLRNLTDAPGTDSDPVWSPDGTRIAFTSTRDGPKQIYVMNADGSNQVNASRSQFDDTEPAWQAVPTPAPTTTG